MIDVKVINGELSDAEKQAYIKRAHELPEKTGRYLVHTSCIANYRPLKDNVFVAGFVNRDWVFEGWESNLVTHWQSLPTPPKEE